MSVFAFRRLPLHGACLRLTCPPVFSPSSLPSDAFRVAGHQSSRAEAGGSGVFPGPNTESANRLHILSELIKRTIEGALRT